MFASVWVRETRRRGDEDGGQDDEEAYEFSNVVFDEFHENNQFTKRELRRVIQLLKALTVDYTIILYSFFMVQTDDDDDDEEEVLSVHTVRLLLLRALYDAFSPSPSLHLSQLVSLTERSWPISSSFFPALSVCFRLIAFRVETLYVMQTLQVVLSNVFAFRRSSAVDMHCLRCRRLMKIHPCNFCKRI